jgi:opacity protein-like surface antigen
MKPITRTISFTAAVLGVALLLCSTTDRAVAETDFFQKFTPVDPCNWAGFYLGFNIGAGFNRFDLGKQVTDVNLEDQFYEIEPTVVGELEIFATFHTPGHHETDTETIGGGQTGFNFQFGHFIVGFEGGFQGNGSTADTKYNEFQENPLFLATIQQNVVAETDFTNIRMVETIWNAYFGGKLGFCWERFLFYITGGAAFTDAHFESWQRAETSFFSNICEGDCAQAGPHQGQFFLGQAVNTTKPNQGDVLTGWYGGVGTEYKLTNIVSVGFEYKHVDWGDVHEHFMGGSGPIFAGNGHLDLSADQILFKVNLLVGPVGH